MTNKLSIIDKICIKDGNILWKNPSFMDSEQKYEIPLKEVSLVGIIKLPDRNMNYAIYEEAEYICVLEDVKIKENIIYGNYYLMDFYKKEDFFKLTYEQIQRNILNNYITLIR